MTAADFLPAILATPDDDGPRLVFADWLEEQGDVDRAEFIRVQCRLAELEKVPGRPKDGMELLGWLMGAHQERRVIRAVMGVPGCDCEQCLRQQEEKLLSGPIKGLLASLLVEFDEDFGVIDLKTRRGFVYEIKLQASAWMYHAKRILAAAPVQMVELTTWPPDNYDFLQWTPLRAWGEQFKEKWLGITFRWPPVSLQWETAVTSN